MRKLILFSLASLLCFKQCSGTGKMFNFDPAKFTHINPLTSDQLKMKYVLYPDWKAVRSYSSYYHFEMFPLPNVKRVPVELTHIKKPEKLTIMVHGFLGHAKKARYVRLKNEFAKYANAKDIDGSLVVVDWQKGARAQITKPESYMHAVKTTRTVAEDLSRFIIEIAHDSVGFDLKDIHLVGFSLGAHVVGMAGEMVHKHFDGRKIGHITGLDPAGPYFNRCTNESEFLNKEDADFVDVIHTCLGGKFGLGIDRASGHIDFYPNGGSGQPWCFLNNFICSHNSAVDYYQESIKNLAENKKCNFPAWRCADYSHFENRCGITQDSDENHMGYAVRPVKNETKDVKMYLLTRPSAPVCSDRLSTVTSLIRRKTTRAREPVGAVFLRENYDYGELEFLKNPQALRKWTELYL